MRLTLMIVLGAGAAAVSAQAPVDRQQRQVRQVVVYGSDPCPVATAREIIVCARRPETERYRIPAPVRDELDEGDPRNRSWAERARGLDETGEALRGPGACEPVGPTHHTGCTQEMLEAYRAQREAAAEGAPPQR